MTKGDSITIAISCSNNHLNLMCHQISHNAPRRSGSKSRSSDLSALVEDKHISYQEGDKPKPVSSDDTEMDMVGVSVSGDQSCDPNMSHDASQGSSVRCPVSSLSHESSTGTATCDIRSHDQSCDQEGLPDIERMDLNAASHNTTRETQKRSDGSNSCVNHSERTLHSFHLDEHDIAFLNDTSTQNAILNALCRALLTSQPLPTESALPDDTSKDAPGSSVCRTSATTNSDKTSSVLDLCHGLSMAGLYAAKLDRTTRVCITQSDPHHQHALQCVGRSNVLDMEKRVTFADKSSVLNPSSDALWDVVVVDLVEPTGVLRQHVLEDIAVAR